MPKPTVALLFAPELQKVVIGPETFEKYSARLNIVVPKSAGKVTPEAAQELLKTAEGCMTCWGSPKLSAEVLAHAPKLKIMSHSAGTVKHLVSDAVFARGIAVTSCAAIIADDVADFTLGAIIFGMKNVMEVSPRIAQLKNWDKAREGLYRAPDDARSCTVGVISASQVGKRVLKLLPHFGLKALVYDPFITSQQARELNAEKVELDAIFERSDVVTCHAPTVPATQNMVNAARLAKMRDGAVFINTARGWCVDEKALAGELNKRRIWAFLDVFEPEPPAPESPLYSCPNLTMTPHIAGSTGRGRLRMGEQAFKELANFLEGKPVEYGITQKMLETMA